MASFEKCDLCPRNCGVNRVSGERGYCGQGPDLRVAWTGLHYGEEPEISGTHGSGMIFFMGCSLGCPFCQNHQISIDTSSHEGAEGVTGRVYTPESLSDKCVEFERAGAETISFVTAEHFWPLLPSVCLSSRSKGVTVPFVFNTSGWVTPQCVESLFPYIGVWNWDYKAASAEAAESFTSRSDYPKVVEGSFKRLISLSEKAPKTQRPIIIVRHLVVPGHFEESERVLRLLAPYRSRIILSLLSQFTPINDAARSLGRIEKEQWEHLEQLVFDLGFENGYIQDIADEAGWVPDFARVNPFGRGHAKPI